MYIEKAYEIYSSVFSTNEQAQVLEDGKETVREIYLAIPMKDKDILKDLLSKIDGFSLESFLNFGFAFSSLDLLESFLKEN